MTKDNARFAKSLVFMNCAVPAGLLAWDAWNGELGANPVNFAIHTTGLMSLLSLVLSLTITPLRQLGKWDWLVPMRRTLGLYAFYYAVAHLIIFFGFHRALSLRSTVSEIIKRPYLWFGTASLLAMVPLAVTSTNAMIRRLGPARWKALHRLAYFAVVAGAVHYYMLVKADVRKPIAFLGATGVLLLYRLVGNEIKVRRGYRKLQAASGSNQTAAKPKFWRGQLRVARVFKETRDVRTIRLAAIKGTTLPFDYLPGQYLNLVLNIDGKDVKRSYTIASTPTRQAYCELTIKREAMGLSSGYLHENIREGDLLNVSAPAGRFTFTGAEAPSVVMIAGGVGITPLMAKIRYLTDIGWTGDIYLLFSARTQGDIIFRDELSYLQQRHPNLHVAITLTRAENNDWHGLRGRISAAMLNETIPDITTRRIHICGPDVMAAETGKMLMELGVAAENIHVESFTPPRQETTASAEKTEIADDKAHEISFARSGKSWTADPGQSVLEASESADINIDFECRSGICGRCKVKLIDGRVAMDTTDALSAADAADGFILSCQARCVTDIAVDA